MDRQLEKTLLFSKNYGCRMDCVDDSRSQKTATIDFGALERKALAQTSDEWHRQLPEYAKYGLNPPSLQTMLGLAHRKFADTKLCLERETGCTPDEVARFLRDIKLAEGYSVGIADITKESNTKQMEG